MRTIPTSILVIEDNAGDRRLVLEALKQARGAKPVVASADSLVMARQRLAEHAFDVALLDLTLPDSDGLDTYVKAQALMPGTPIVILSGQDDDDSTVKAVQSGAQDFLVKGQVEPKSLLRALHYAIERFELQRRLRENEERLQLALESAEIGLWDLDVRKDEAFRTARHARIFGYAAPPARWGYETFLAHVHPEDRDLVEKAVGRSVAQGWFDYECRIIRADTKAARWIAVRGHAAVDERGGPSRMLGSVIDITERKKIEQMRNEGIALASHEFKTPLAIIIGTLSGIVDGMTDGNRAEEKRLLGLALDNSRRMLVMTNDYLDMARIDAGKKGFDLHPMDLVARVASAVEANRPFATQNGVPLFFDKAVPRAVVNIDSGRLTQVLTNLISNAVRFSPPGGSVGVRIERRGERMVRTSVNDDGPGISEEFRSSLFEKFATDSSSAPRRKMAGTGLGLSIAKAIVEAMGGRIGCESESGRGANFYFDLPECGAEKTAVL